MVDFTELKRALGDLEEDTVLRLVHQVMDEGGSAASEALQTLQEGLGLIGDRFQSGEYFVGDLIYAGELMTETMDILKPALKGASSEKVGRLVFCTVKDDMHDIGKNIVITILEAHGFEVIDLGVDVPHESIINAVKEHEVEIVALSGVLTLALVSMKNVVDAFRDAGLRDSVRIIIGGSPVSEEACRHIGADAWTQNPQEAVDILKRWCA
jgi:methylmalonyl-CoA mutase cobalamin-binding domain/chain